jgi:Tol biopolymer transport system component
MQLEKVFWGRALLTLTLAVGIPGLTRAGQVELISRVAPDQVSETAVGGDLSPGASLLPPSVSADGRYVAFASGAAHLVPGQSGNHGIVNFFLRDRVAGSTVLVSRSLASATAPVNNGNGEALVSPDGRFVAWSSYATDVAAGQPSGGAILTSNLFLFDRLSGTNQLVGPGDRPGVFSPDGRFLVYLGANVWLYDLTAKSVRSLGAVSSSGTLYPSISADGRFIAFESIVSGTPHLLVFDRVAGSAEDLGSGFQPSISADGRYVAFVSYASNQVPGQVDTNNGADAFLYDRATHATVLVSRSQVSALQVGDRGLPGQRLALSPDGRYVAFVSGSSNVLPNQGSSAGNLFLFDRTTQTVKLVASTTPFSQSDSFVADGPIFSGDGSALVFVSRALDVVPGQASSGGRNVFLYTVASGAIRLVSASSTDGSRASESESYNTAIDGEGRTVVFASQSTNLVSGLQDLDEAEDVFAYAVATGAVEAVSRRAVASATPARGSVAGAVSADGRFIAFASEASHLVSGQVDHQTRIYDSRTDVFLYDAVRQTSLLVSHASGLPATAGDDESWGPALSPDGRYVAFLSRADNLTSSASNVNPNLYLFDRVLGTTVLVSRSALGGGGASGASSAPDFSADGRYFTFASTATDLVPGQVAPDSYYHSNIFLYDRVADALTLVSHTAAGPQATGDTDSTSPSLSADGRYLLFHSDATDLLAGQTGAAGNLFLYDRVTGITRLVSHEVGSATVAGGGLDGGLHHPILSADGRYAAFESFRPDLAAGVTGGDGLSLYLYDRTTGKNTLLLFAYARSRLGNFALSRDGRFLAFEGTGGGFVPGQTGPTDLQQVYLYDRVAHTTVLASHAGTSLTTAAGGRAYLADLSADGRFLAFLHNDPLPTGYFSAPDVFLFDRQIGATVLASPSRVSATTAAGGVSSDSPPRISADGQAVVFTSSSPNLVAADFNGQTDAFVYRLSPLAPGGPVTLPPCVLLDTRRPGNRPALRSNVRRSVTAAGVCGVPATATAVLVKVTALQATGKGNLRLFPGGSPTSAGILRFARNQTRTFSLTVPLGGDGTLALLPFVAGKGTVQAAVEVDGYTP